MTVYVLLETRALGGLVLGVYVSEDTARAAGQAFALQHDVSNPAHASHDDIYIEAVEIGAPPERRDGGAPIARASDR